MTTIRQAESEDHASVAAVVDAWWGRKPMRQMLPRLFFVHFRETSLLPRSEASSSASSAAFSPKATPRRRMCISSGSTRLTEAKDWPRALYERFFEAARGHGRSLVRSVTSRTNLGSIEFHRRLGFEIEGEAANYDGEGSARVLFVKSI